MRIALAPTPLKTYVWLVGYVLLIPLAVYGVLAEFFGLSPWGFVGIGCIGGALIAAVVSMLRASRAELVDGYLNVVGGGLFRQRVALNTLKMDAVQIHYPPRHIAQIVSGRARGLTLPSARFGWFRRKDKVRVFVLATAGNPILELTTEAGPLMLTVANPQDALTRLHRAIAQSKVA